MPVTSPAATWAHAGDACTAMHPATRRDSRTIQPRAMRIQPPASPDALDSISDVNKIQIDRNRLERTPAYLPLSQHDFGRLDDGRDGVAVLEPHLLGASA